MILRPILQPGRLSFITEEEARDKVMRPRPKRQPQVCHAPSSSHPRQSLGSHIQILTNTYARLLCEQSRRPTTPPRGLRHIKQDRRTAQLAGVFSIILFSTVSKFLRKSHRHIDTKDCAGVCVSKMLSFGRTDMWSLTHSLTWLDLEPSSPATTSSSASRSEAARTFCKSCCCSSFVENANSSSSMLASFVITCSAEPSCFLSLDPILPSPRLTWSGHFPPQAQQSRWIITESSS